ncbi:hypothetical protein B0H99_10363 [Planomicrobium soli]|uniref:YolD-like protein n=1 Tax=Planomicrobium soli TaxID=1176648 RepID=A0A2P8H3Y7_9BACL|nr:hypothetical protein [Planomicrobium soli]PSL40931.1 hypothetical protein B0H99_10363 [Planomicrobium soli]
MEYAWENDNEVVCNSQPMLSAAEQIVILAMMLVAYERKCPLIIQFWQDRHYRYKRCTIRELDWKQQLITYEEAFGGQYLENGAISSI